MSETKSEIRARLAELDLIQHEHWCTGDGLDTLIDRRKRELQLELSGADEDLFVSVLASHRAICAVKKMDEKAAYGQDPAHYYTLAVCGEAGEMANKIVKADRNGNKRKKLIALKDAVISELPDIFIYGAVLAHAVDVNIIKLVNEKVQVVIQRAESGYYGGPLDEDDDE